MKRTIAFVLLAVMLLGLCACGSIHDAQVSVLWSGEGVVKTPNSLENAIERAMYIQNIAYTHTGANGDQATQTKQAEDALNAGCVALLVELVDSSAAQSIVDLAKAKNVPVVFFNCKVEQSVISGYEKCALVYSDAQSLGSVQGKQIAEYVTKNTKAMDRNADGKLSYVAVGDVTDTVANAGEGLESAAQVTAEEFAGLLEQHSDENGNMIELVITASDEEALTVLEALQSKDYNTTRLTTHCIPVFTVGADADATAFTETGSMTEEELAVFIYNAMSLIDAGQLAGTAMEDYDALAEQAAAIMAQLLKGQSVESSYVAVPYKAY